MADTYCGKDCAVCTYREKLACPGCKTGPGRKFGGDCELAKCCADKGHADCTTCTREPSCATLRRRDHLPQYRLQERERQAARREEALRRAPVLAKWIGVLFWLVVPATVASIFANETVAELLPNLYWPGQVLNAACTLIYGLVLLKLAGDGEEYRTAGTCTLIAMAASLAALAFGSANWTLVFALPGAVVAFVGEYYEYQGHAGVLEQVDQEQSERWRRLWKWYIATFACTLGSILLILIIPMLGLLAVLAGAIGMIVVDILKLVYLYRMARTFREMKK